MEAMTRSLAVRVREGLAAGGIDAARDPAAVRALIERAIADAQDLGHAAVVLGTNRGNKEAQAFYKRHGFRKRSSRTFDVGGVRNYDVVMVRDLTA